jgi:hypothetical protein
MLSHEAQQCKGDGSIDGTSTENRSTKFCPPGVVWRGDRGPFHMELSEPLFFFNFLSLSVSLSLSLSLFKLHLRGLAKRVRCGTDGS